MLSYIVYDCKIVRLAATKCHRNQTVEPNLGTRLPKLVRIRILVKIVDVIGRHFQGQRWEVHS